MIDNEVLNLIQRDMEYNFSCGNDVPITITIEKLQDTLTLRLKSMLTDHVFRKFVFVDGMYTDNDRRVGQYKRAIGLS